MSTANNNDTNLLMGLEPEDYDITTNATPEEMKEVYLTRPFIYIISEKSTGAIFFIGSYMGD